MESPDDQTILNNFGKALEKIRMERGISQRELADRIDKDQAQIVRYEKGQINLTVISLYRLAKALGVTPADLLPAIK